MNKGGIFNSFGAADLAGQTLLLAPKKVGGSAPLASGLQEIIKKMGYGKLPVDGNWGDCSQRAYINAYGTPPTPSNVVQFHYLDTFGVQPSQVQTWSKTNPVCTDGSSEFTKESDVVPSDPVGIIARAFGVPNPYASQGCPSGSYKNVNTGACEQFESPQQMPPATSLLSRLKLIAAPKPTFQLAPVTSDRKFTLIPKTAAAPRLSLVKAPSISKLSFMPSNDKKYSIMPFVKGGAASPGGAVVGGAPAGMSAGAKLAIGAVAVAAIGGIGYMLWKRSQASAVPNGWWDDMESIQDPERRHNEWWAQGRRYKRVAQRGREYAAARRAMRDGTATPEQIAYVDALRRSQYSKNCYSSNCYDSNCGE